MSRPLGADADDSLRDLRGESLFTVVLFLGLINYVWLVLVVWPGTGRNVPAAAWIGSLLLAASLITSYALRERALRTASQILVVGILLAVTCAMLAYRSSHLAYLFVLPISLASMFLEPKATALTTAASLVLIARISVADLRLPFFSAETLIPMGLTVMITIASWLFAHNLSVVLEWVWNGYEQALRNYEVSQQRGAELRQTLRALDEAMYRLERTQQSLALALEQADEARRVKQQFAQTISHELRTPLNLIIGFTELMAQSPEYYGHPLPGPYVRDLSIVHRNASHLQSLVNDVLDLARIEATDMGLALESVSPADLATEAVATARSLVESQGLALQTDIEPDLPNLRADATRIRQVLFNLLNNAARFTEQGGVKVSVHRQGDEVIFAVQDTGVGIAQEDIPKVFREFKQLDTGTRRRRGGMGLGLAISKSFVELHGGRIWCTSQVGVGSTFSFSLPLPRSDMPKAQIARFARSRPRAAPRDQDERSIVLAITSSLSAAGLLTRYLQGARTLVAHDLEQGQEMAQELLPQVVVIDVASVTLKEGQASRLSREWGIPRVPFVACPLPGEEPMRHHLGAAGYLTKPVTAAALWTVMRQFSERADSVLVVDDDRDFVRLLARLLDNPVRRYTVRTAYSGQEALETLRRWEPDLLLLDLGLPDMRGEQIIRHMQAEDRWRGIPIVVVTGQEGPDPGVPLRGNMTISKAEGLVPGETIRWIQGIVDSTTQSPPKG